MMATKVADAHRFTLFGGARGPGKSFWLRWYLLRMLLRYAAHGIIRPTVGLFCEDYPSLTDRQISKIAVEFPQFLGGLRETKAQGFGFYLNPEYGGGLLALRNLDDPSKYQSSEFAGIGIDELTKNSFDTFTKLRGSLRFPGVDRTQFVAATNPGDIGHAWVKSIWVDGKFPVELRELEKEFAFVPALPDDNPFLSKTYWTDLETLPERLRRAWRFGEWDAFEGAFFTEFDRPSEMEDPFEIPSSWTLMLGVDPGYSSACAGVLGARDHTGIVHILGTSYEKGNNPDANALKMKAWLTDESSYLWPITHGRMPQLIVSGHDAWHHKDRNAILRSDATFADEFAKHGLHLQHATLDRVQGWWAMKGLMPERLKFFKQYNQPLIDEMQSMVGDELKPEDISGRGLDPDVADHACDAARYLIMAIHRPADTFVDQPDWFRDFILQKNIEGWKVGMG